MVTAILAWGCASASAADQTITFPTAAAAGPYTPANVSVDPGDSVTFTGAFANHPLEWDAATFLAQSTGTSMAYTFTTPGLYRFHCQIHPSMVGSVNVGGDALATPDFTWSPASPQTGQPVTFTPTGFADPDGSIARYEWDLDGDGSFEASGSAPTHVYSSAGAVTAALRYVDDRNETSSATTHAFTVVRGAGGGSGGGTTPAPGQPGGAGGYGAPVQPGAPGSPSSPAGGAQGAGPSGAETTAPRLRLGARALAFAATGRARVAITAPRASTVTATLKRGRTTLATGSAKLKRAGAASVTLELTRAGKRVLGRAHGSVRATLTVVARAGGNAGGAAATVTKTLSARMRT
jgi:plastocyanin